MQQYNNRKPYVVIVPELISLSVAFLGLTIGGVMYFHFLSQKTSFLYDRLHSGTCNKINCTYLNFLDILLGWYDIGILNIPAPRSAKFCIVIEKLSNILTKRTSSFSRYFLEIIFLIAEGVNKFLKTFFKVFVSKLIRFSILSPTMFFIYIEEITSIRNNILPLNAS